MHCHMAQETEAKDGLEKLNGKAAGAHLSGKPHPALAIIDDLPTQQHTDKFIKTISSGFWPTTSTLLNDVAERCASQRSEGCLLGLINAVTNASVMPISSGSR